MPAPGSDCVGCSWRRFDSHIDSAAGQFHWLDQVCCWLVFYCVIWTGNSRLADGGRAVTIVIRPLLLSKPIYRAYEKGVVFPSTEMINLLMWHKDSTVLYAPHCHGGKNETWAPQVQVLRFWTKNGENLLFSACCIFTAIPTYLLLFH